MKMTDEMQLLRDTGADVKLLDLGCCGMAGPFGFEKDKYDVSQALAERVLLPAVRSAKPGTFIVADGFGCASRLAELRSARTSSRRNSRSRSLGHLGDMKLDSSKSSQLLGSSSMEFNYPCLPAA